MNVLEAPRWEAVDRNVAMVPAVGALLAVLAGIGAPGPSWQGSVAVTWNIVGIAFCALAIAMPILGRILPVGMLRGAWAGILLGYLALVVALPLAMPLHGEWSRDPWILVFEIAADALAAVALPLPLALGYAGVAAIALPAATFVFSGSVPPAMLTATLVHYPNFIGVLAVSVFATQLRRLWSAQRADYEGAVRTERHDAMLAEGDRIAALIHDEVLSTLAMAAMLPVPADASLREQGARAIGVLDRETRAHPGPEAISTANVVADLRARATTIDPAIGIETAQMPGEMPGEVPGEVPAEVALTVSAALGEAIRNSVRHAGPSAVRRVLLVVAAELVTVELRDDGVGFDPANVASDRLGLRRSIVARMCSLPGGSASVESRPGGGTHVVLRWTRA